MVQYLYEGSVCYAKDSTFFPLTILEALRFRARSDSKNEIHVILGREEGAHQYIGLIQGRKGRKDLDVLRRLPFDLPPLLPLLSVASATSPYTLPFP